MNSNLYLSHILLYLARMKKVFLLSGLLISFINGFAQQPKLVLPMGHLESIYSIDFSPDGKKIVTAGSEPIAKIWDLNTGLLLADLNEHILNIRSAKYSPDGKKIVTTSPDGTAKIWNANTGIICITLLGHTKGINSVEFSKDGSMILTSSGDGTAKIWDAATGRILNEFIGHLGYVYSASFNSNGTKIVTTSSDRTAKIWDAKSGVLLTNLIGDSAEMIEYINGRRDEVFKSAEFSPDGNRILTPSSNNDIIIWDATSGVRLKTLLGHQANINSAQYSPDGTKIVTSAGGEWVDLQGKQDHTAKIWDANSGVLITTLTGHTRGVLLAQFSPDSKKIITASFDETVKIWDANTGKLITNLTDNTSRVYSAKFSKDSKKIAIGYYGDSKIWDANTGVIYSTLQNKIKGFNEARFSSDGTKILTVFGDAKVWDLTNGRLLKTLTGSEFTNARFSPNSSKVITSSLDNSVKIWDSNTGTLLLNGNKSSQKIYTAQFSPDGNKIAAVFDDDKSALWNASNGSLISNLKVPPIVVPEIVYDNTGPPLPPPPPPLVRILYSDRETFELFSPDSKKVITFNNNNMKVWNTDSGNFITSFSVTSAEHNQYINSSQFSSNSKTILTASTDNTAKIWDANTGNLIVTFTGHIKEVNMAQFSPDNKKVVTISEDNTTKIWDSRTGNLITDLRGQTGNSRFSFAKFSPNGKTIITFSNGQKVLTWDANTGILVAELKGHTSNVIWAEFSKDGKKIITTSSDQTAKVWDAETNQLIYTLIAVDSVDYINLLSSGYYQCTYNASKLFHYVTSDLKVITFEQLDVRYNRPDKVLEAIGCQDTALISSYRKAYYKRIKKLGIDTASFQGGYSVPESEFENRDAVEYEQKTDKLLIHVKGIDSIFKLDRFNIWVNEIPLFGQKGFNIKKRKRNDLDTAITIQLSDGVNRIETSILNVNGTESYRMPLLVNYSPEIKSKEKLHFIGIGIDKFADTTYNLQYSVKDIRDLTKKLKEKFGNEVSIDTLFNENVTIENIKALKKKLLQTSINDKVIISYSGHGLLSKDYDYYLSTFSVNFDKPQQNGLAYDELENLLDSIPARKKLMLIDACHSGEVDKDEALAMNNAADSLKLFRPKGGKMINNNSQKQLGLKSSFELMQSLFVNVGKSTGATIISAAAGNQFALEKGDLKNGVFTYCILEAMNSNSTMTVTQLKSTVGKRVVEITNGLQKPTSRNETINSDWSVW